MGPRWPVSLFLQLTAAVHASVQEVKDRPVGFVGPLALAVARNLSVWDAVALLRRRSRAAQHVYRTRPQQNRQQLPRGPGAP
jgi:hypothetical protein